VARADLLIDVVQAANRGDEVTLRRAVEALIADERAKNHHVLADRLANLMKRNGQLFGRGSPIAAPGVQSDIHDLVFETSPERPLDNLILTADVRSACLELVEEQHRADLLRSHNLEPRNRILLAGPPGNGKTSLAEGIAYELALPLVTARYEGIIGSFLGETATRLRRVFEYVRERRCVLFFDEFDAIAKERGDIHETGEIKRVVSALLLQIDALPTYVTVITASNHPELLDRAVWRRFQLRLVLDKPRPSQIAEWFQRFQQDIGEPLGRSPESLARALRGLSFAELEEFTLDVKRRYVLGTPDARLNSIVRSRLNHWKARFSIASE
jgi:SpoVK/Ycf46/Vps4 family AAA+-type ATPase